MHVLLAVGFAGFECDFDVYVFTLDCDACVSGGVAVSVAGGACGSGFA